jgi:hypothetical protein
MTFIGFFIMVVGAIIIFIDNGSSIANESKKARLVFEDKILKLEGKLSMLEKEQGSDQDAIAELRVACDKSVVVNTIEQLHKKYEWLEMKVNQKPPSRVHVELSTPTAVKILSKSVKPKDPQSQLTKIKKQLDGL